MSENFRAVVALMILALPSLWYLRAPLTANLIARADYDLRARLWVGLTILLFVGQSFWLFMFVATVLLLTLGRRDSNPLGLYLFLLFLAPPFQSAIQGFAGINYFIAIDYLRLLSIVILLPIAARLLVTAGTPGLLKMPTDKFVFGYVALLLVIQAPVTSTTDLLRSVVTHVIDTLLPYYVFSRGITDWRRLRDSLASFVTAGALIAVIAVFEFFKGWLLYSSLPNVLNVRWNYGGYMVRDGALRATVSMGHSIVLGYVLTVALGLYFSLQSAGGNSRRWRNMGWVLGAGIVAAMARGPWVGAVAMMAVVIGLGPGLAGRIGKVGLAAICLVPVMMMTPVGGKILSLLPFIGSVNADSVSYRQQLFEVSWKVLMLNPFFGSPYYMHNAAMEQMRQGEGIIDMVNSYLGVAMVSGFIGLGLFVGAFVSCVVRLAAHLARHPAKGSDDYIMGRALLATLVGVLVIIATASSINAIPVVYWSLIGMCAAYLHLVAAERKAPKRVAARQRDTQRAPSY